MLRKVLWSVREIDSNLEMSEKNQEKTNQSGIKREW